MKAKKDKLLMGGVTINVDGKSHQSAIVGGEDFSFQLNRALEKSNNPATALLFLAELGARTFRPDSMAMRFSDIERWNQLFGHTESKTVRPMLTLVSG